MQFGFSESVAHWGRYRPQAIGLIYNGEPLSYARLSASVDILAKRIHAQTQVKARIAIAAKSKAATLVGILAIARAGRSAVVLHHGLTNECLRVNLIDANPQTLLHDGSDSHYSKLFSEVLGGTTIEISEWLAHADLPRPLMTSWPSTKPEDEWGIVFSSGTTGPSKAIVRDHYSMMTEHLGWCLELELRRGSTFYIGRPIFYTGGLVLALSTLTVCGCIILDDFADNDDPMLVWNAYQVACKARSVDCAFFIPDQLRLFCKLVKKSGTELGMAKIILVMGAPISGGEKIETASILRSDVIESWGNSESLGTITDPEDLKKRPDSIGRPFLTDELFIVDNEGQQRGPGEFGRIAGGLEAGFTGYSGREQETTRVRRDEFIVSDDIGYVDSDGYFYVQGREQDFVIIQGKSVVLPQVEAVIRLIPYVRECCVVAVNLSLNDLQLVGAIVLSDPITSDQAILLESINKDANLNPGLSRIIILPALPRLPSGKVDRQGIIRTLGQPK